MPADSPPLAHGRGNRLSNICDIKTQNPAEAGFLSEKSIGSASSAQALTRMSSGSRST
ncbi:hypothetical protein X737_06490 [Mesorhizobium sp. L48C026A00]|nr:hypothetical protein X737_06490 [Mesorhizobium sp. L48C026A00]